MQCLELEQVETHLKNKREDELLLLIQIIYKLAILIDNFYLEKNI